MSAIQELAKRVGARYSYEIPVTMRFAFALYSATGMYDWEADAIYLRPLETMLSAEHADRVLAHELIHWTGHPTRLARESLLERNYELEEIVAEAGAELLLRRFNGSISAWLQDDMALYVGRYMLGLGNDPKQLGAARQLAALAVEYLEEISHVSTRSHQTRGDECYAA